MKKTKEITMVMPEVEGFEYTGEFRKVAPGEFYLSDTGSAIWKSDYVSSFYDYPILKKAPKAYEIGQRFKAGGEEFILASVCNGKIALISTETGACWAMPVTCFFVFHITEEELKAAMGTSPHMFTLIED